MAKVLDVAAYILKARGPMTAMKLQKLVYYSQAWHLVWDDEALFEESVEAWANGPVSPVLYRAHRGKFQVHFGDFSGDPNTLTAPERESVEAVLNFYGGMTAQQLSDLTHREDPWNDAREGRVAGERSYDTITQAAMAEYYGSL